MLPLKSTALTVYTADTQGDSTHSNPGRYVSVRHRSAAHRLDPHDQVRVELRNPGAGEGPVTELLSFVPGDAGAPSRKYLDLITIVVCVVRRSPALLAQ